MSIEILGLFTHRPGAEHKPKPMSDFDMPFLTKLVQDYDKNGYDRMLIANAATWPDSIPFAAYIAGITERVAFMIAHRPGFVPPTMAARMLATIDRVSKGRCAVHIITGANDKEMEADGDFTNKVDRYARSAEYVDVLRKMWTSDKPFDHAGEFYKFNGAFSALKPHRPEGIPVFWGGSSPESLLHAGRCADVYAMGIDTVARTNAIFNKVRAHAAVHNRCPKFLLSLRLLIGDTEQAAWDKAEKILEGVVANLAVGQQTAINTKPTERYAELCKLDDRLDNRLWTGITKVTNGTKAVTSLVGTAEQVVDELVRYYDIGVSHFLMSGFDYENDPTELGRTVIPMLRERVKGRVPKDVVAPALAATGT